MNGTLPTPILQQVSNSGLIFISWRYLGSPTLWALVRLYDNSGLVQQEQSDRGSIFYNFKPTQPLNNPPYSIRLAATDGTNIGPESVAIPVIVYIPIIRELTYDTVKVAVTLKSPTPPPPANTYYVMTTYKDGDGENSPPFTGLKGQGTLDHAPATANCYSIVVANLDIPQDQFSCTSTGPPSDQVGIITQPATIERVQYMSNGQVEVDATGPSSVGPPITGHRHVFGNEVCGMSQQTGFAETAGVISKDSDGDHAVLELTAEIDPSQPTCVMAAGMNISANRETTSVGPFCTPLQMITQAPSFLSLMSTTASKLMANWSAVPGTDIGYIVELFRDSELIDHQPTAQLNFTFAAQFEQGRVYTVAVMATADQGKVIGPLSAQAPGPFRSNAPTVVYDSLGRLQSMSITGYRTLTYTLDSFGNITNAKVS